MGFKIRHMMLFAAVLAALAVGPGPASGDAETVIAVRTAAEVSGDRICLGDIAEIRGPDAELIQRLDRLFISQSPRPERMRSVSRRLVTFRLKQNDLNDRVRLDMPDRIDIRRPGVRVPKARIETMIRNALRAEFAGQDGVRIQEVTVRGDVVLPPGAMHHEIVLPRERRSGAVPLTVRFLSGGDVRETVSAVARISAFAPVVVARTPLARFQPVSPADIGIENRDLSAVAADALTDVAEAAGKRASRNIASGTVLTADLLELPPMVRRGDIVRILAESGRVRITALGEVRETGRRGERIRVVNLDTQKEIQARVIDPGTVAVMF